MQNLLSIFYFLSNEVDKSHVDAIMLLKNNSWSGKAVPMAAPIEADTRLAIDWLGSQAAGQLSEEPDDF